MRRIIVVIIGILLIVCVSVPLVIGLPTSAGQGGAAGGRNALPALRRVAVDRGDVNLIVTATGSLVAKQQSNLSFNQAGNVVEVLVTEGQKVEAGQLLARQDDSTQKSNLAQAEFNLKAADASLQKLLRPVDPGDIAKAEANVKAAQGSYSSQASGVNPATVKTYQLQYQQAAANAQNAEKLRIEAGGRYTTTDDPNYQKFVAQVGQASFAAEAARLRLEQASRGSSLARATANITYQQALLAQVKAGVKQSDVDAAQAQYEIAKLQRDQAQHDLDSTHLTAPFAGVVSTVSVKPGQVSSGSAMILTDTGQLYADINVDETDIGKIKIGQTIQLTLDALPGVNLTGKVQRIAQTADTTASVIAYVVRIVLDPVSAPIKIGMTANATFVASQLHNVLRIPSEYLKVDRANNQITVNLVHPDGSFTPIPIQVGLQGTDYAEVVGGLNEGEMIALITNSAAVNAGQ